MHLRGDSVREIPFMLFLGLLFAVTVGWWVFLTLTVSVVFGNVAAAVFAVCSALSVTVGYGLVRASDSRGIRDGFRRFAQGVQREAEIERPS